MENYMLEVVMFLLATVVSLAGWLLRQKDAQQAEQIKLLFSKYDKVAQEILDLRIRIAERHYERQELDRKFEQLDHTFKEGFKELGIKFDRLSDTLLTHVSQETKGGN